MEVKSAQPWRFALRMIGLLMIGLVLLVASPARAQEGAQAGLVIVTGSGEAATYCVALAPDETITGSELIQRAGVQAVVEQNAMGGTICSLNGTGCAFPAESCFCRCQGTPCVYWSYWRQDDAGVWQYAVAGASNTRVRAGTVEGWVWGEGTTDAAQSPPASTLADICAAPASTAAVAPADGGAQSAVQATVQTSVQADVSGVVSQPAAVADAAAAPVQSNNTWALAGLAALVFIPVAALLLLRRRKDNA